MALPDAGSKVTIFFTSQGGTAPTGWTENFYLLGGPSQVALQNIVNTYIPKRADMLGVGAQIESLRISAVPPSRVTFVQFLVGAQGQGKTFSNAGPDDFDPTQVDLLCRIQTAEGKRRQFWIAGLPDSQTDQLLAQGVRGAFINSPAFKQFAKAMVDSGFCVRWRNNPGVLPAAFSATPIQTVQPIMIRNRKRGRPFDLFRGRRLA